MRAIVWIGMVGLLAACKAGAGDKCQLRKQDCGQDLICVKPPSGSTHDATCMTQEQANDLCHQEKLCKLSGACSYTPKGGGVCAPQTNEDCRRSEPCVGFGRCTADKHMCIVASDDDCKGSALCKEHGKCTAVTDKRPGRCVREK